MRKKTILIVYPHVEDEGSCSLNRDNNYRELVLDDYLKKNLSHEVYHLRLVRPHTSSSVTNDTNIFHFTPDEDYSRSKGRFVSREMLSCIERLRPDLLIFRGLGYRLAGWLAAKSKHRFRVAFIAGGGTFDPIIKYADYILAESSQQIEQSFRWHLNQKRVCVLPKLHRRIPKLSESEKLFDVINVGRFEEFKNQKALLPLAEQYKVALIGDGETYSAVKKLAGKCRKPVFMPGEMQWDEVIDYISQSRIMVHASYREGTPRVVMEAFECGVPVIGLRSALEGVFDNGIHGRLVASDELVYAAQNMLADPHKLAVMGKNARVLEQNQCKRETVLKVVDEMLKTVFSDSTYAPSRRLTRVRAHSVLVKSDIRFLLSRYRILKRIRQMIRKASSYHSSR